MINNLMNGEAFEFVIWMICLLHQSYLKIDQGRKNVSGDPGERLCDNMNSSSNSSFSLLCRFW